MGNGKNIYSDFFKSFLGSSDEWDESKKVWEEAQTSSRKKAQERDIPIIDPDFVRKIQETIGEWEHKKPDSIIPPDKEPTKFKEYHNNENLYIKNIHEELINEELIINKEISSIQNHTISKIGGIIWWGLWWFSHLSFEFPDYTEKTVQEQIDLIKGWTISDNRSTFGGVHIDIVDFDSLEEVPWVLDISGNHPVSQIELIRKVSSWDLLVEQIVVWEVSGGINDIIQVVEASPPSLNQKIKIKLQWASMRDQVFASLRLQSILWTASDRVSAMRPTFRKIQELSVWVMTSLDMSLIKEANNAFGQVNSRDIELSDILSELSQSIVVGYLESLEKYVQDNADKIDDEISMQELYKDKIEKISYFKSLFWANIVDGYCDDFVKKQNEK